MMFGVDLRAGVTKIHPTRLRLTILVGLLSALTLAGLSTAWAQGAQFGQDDPLSSAVLEALQQGSQQQSTQGLQPSTDIRISPYGQAPYNPYLSTQPPNASGTFPYTQQFYGPGPAGGLLPGQGAQAGSPQLRQLSDFEQLVSNRVGQRVFQFGYDVFGRGGPIVLRQTGAIIDSYVLGQGDELVVTFRGQQNRVDRTRVDRDGRIVLQGLPPIGAAGRAFGDVRNDLESAVLTAYAGTEAFVSVGELRQLNVRVVGEVNIPGAYSVTGLSTALDALTLAGGIKNSGSLRNLQIVRGNQTIALDLYAFLTGQNVDANVSLAEGDRIVVPLIGRTVTVVGSVKRPAIYELAPGQTQRSVLQLVTLAGGTVIRGAYRYSILRTLDDGRRDFIDVAPEENAFIGDGEILFVNPAVDVSLSRVEVAGTINLTGYYALSDVPTLRSLFSTPEMFVPATGAPSPYMLLAGIIRVDETSMQRTVIPFSPVNVINGTQDIPLRSNDVVYILNYLEMQAIAQSAMLTQEAAARQFVDERPGAQSNLNPLSVIGSQSNVDGSSNSASQQQFLENVPNGLGLLGPGGSTVGSQPQAAPGLTNPNAAGGALPFGQTTPNFVSPGPMQYPGQQAALGQSDEFFGGLLEDEQQLLAVTLGHYYVSIQGAVNNPGAYLAAPDTSLERLVQVAGGVTPRADLNAVEVTTAEIDNASGVSVTRRQTYQLSETQFSEVVLQPYDRIRFNEVFSDRDDGEVSLFGEVRYPGSYEILRGERLSSVLSRAGGLTTAAYPFGAVFLRPSVAAQEREILRRQADQIETQLAGLIGSQTQDQQLTQSEIQYVLQLTERLRTSDTPLGRVALQIDPAQLAANPELDVILEPGDRLYIPRRPASIIIAGEVMAPSGIQYELGVSVSDYIARAGGTTPIADRSRIFVIYPDGSAVQVGGSSLWNYENTSLAPGSVIVVPRTLRPFNWTAFLTNLTQVTSQLAVTAASIVVIGR